MTEPLRVALPCENNLESERFYANDDQKLRQRKRRWFACSSAPRSAKSTLAVKARQIIFLGSKWDIQTAAGGRRRTPPPTLSTFLTRGCHNRSASLSHLFSSSRQERIHHGLRRCHVWLMRVFDGNPLQSFPNQKSGRSSHITYTFSSCQCFFFFFLLAQAAPPPTASATLALALPLTRLHQSHQWAAFLRGWLCK